ncbi:hypothetical protein ACTSKR_07380 [Chitinibacteraceae bacterium HSL-7]
MKFAFVLTLLLASSLSVAGALDPDCTAEKAAKGAATKAVVGVGGRCDMKETVSDSAKRAAGVEEKGPIEKKLDHRGPAEKAADALKD